VQKFNPRMTLRVRRRGKPTKLAYHDGKTWVVFTDVDHKFSLTDKSGIAYIRDWGDPPVAWG